MSDFHDAQAATAVKQLRALVELLERDPTALVNAALHHGLVEGQPDTFTIVFNPDHK